MVLVKFKTDLNGGEVYLDNTCDYVYNQESEQQEIVDKVVTW